MGAILAVTCTRPLAAHAEPPASNQLLRLDDRLLRARKVRITTLSGRLVADGVRASVEGLALRHVLTTTGGETLPVPDHIPWEEVIRVDLPSNHALAAGLATGFVVGGVAGVGVYSAGQQGNDIGGGGIALLGMPVIALLGAVVGGHMHTWHPVYRMKHAPAGRQ